MRRIARKTGISPSAETSCRDGRNGANQRHELPKSKPAILTYINFSLKKG
jgi:hypothetical protein